MRTNAKRAGLKRNRETDVTGTNDSAGSGADRRLTRPASQKQMPDDRHPHDQRPSAWVERWLGTPRGSGRLIDLACGSGRHVRLGLEAGFEVTAADRNIASLTYAQGRTCAALEVDLENGRWLLPAGRFEVVIVTHYLYRPRLALTGGLLEPGGRLIYETFADGNAAFGKPSNPAFLLRQDELFDACRRSGLAVVAFEQGYSPGHLPSHSRSYSPSYSPDDSPLGRGAMLQRIVAVRPPLGAAMALR